MNFIKKNNIYFVPVLHYTMELAAIVRQAFEVIQPDCIAVELPQNLEKACLQAAERLPDISVVKVEKSEEEILHYLFEPCDASCEGLRLGIEHSLPTYCIDLDVQHYPLFRDALPDPYAITHIGLEKYYQAYQKHAHHYVRAFEDERRELHMAKRLKELSYGYEKILFIGGIFHIELILKALDYTAFPSFTYPSHSHVEVCTLTEEACREVLAEYGWIQVAYEQWREQPNPLLDRQKLLYGLYKKAGERYQESTGNVFRGYHLKTMMKFVRNYAFLTQRLQPNLFQLLSAARGCVDHNYAYETWLLATEYPHRKNIDNLKELPLTIEQIWGNTKHLKFELKQKRRKGLTFQKRKKDTSKAQFYPPAPFSICSYPPEDVVIENFGSYLKKKGNLLLSEEGARTAPFTTSLEDGLDTKETIRHWHEHKLYVKIHGRPPGAASSVVVIFDEDAQEESSQIEKFPWKTTWIGEHNQESDMAFYATSMYKNIVGPGISRCEYGGFMMTSPPRRLYDVWEDPDYSECRTKAEVLLVAAIDYAVKPVVVYVANKPPRTKIKHFARRFGKKIVYIPLSQLSPKMLSKIRFFHVLDGHHKREIAGDYIF